MPLVLVDLDDLETLVMTTGGLLRLLSRHLMLAGATPL